MGNNQPSVRKKTYYISLATLAGMFFILGFVSQVNSILVPYFRIPYELIRFKSYLIAFAFYIAYSVVAIPSGILLKKIGFKKGIMYGFMLAVLGAFISVPAALARQFEISLIGLFSTSTSLVILQTVANPYVIIAGPAGNVARRVNIAGICSKVIGVISPLISAALILKANGSELFALIEPGALDEITENATLNELIQRVIISYITLGTILLLTDIGIHYSILPEINADKQNATGGQGNKHINKKSILDSPYLILGASVIFFRVDTQAITISTIINYANPMRIDLLEVKVSPSYTLGCTIIGYILGIIFIPKYISQENVLIGCILLSLTPPLGVIWTDFDMTLFGYQADTSIFFLSALGFPNALIYAGMQPLSTYGLGEFTKAGSSLLIMGSCDNAILSLIYGHFADQYSLRIGYWALIPCFICLVFFVIRKHKTNSWR